MSNIETEHRFAIRRSEGVIWDEDSTHDATLQISGDFADRKQLRVYTAELGAVGSVSRAWINDHYGSNSRTKSAKIWAIGKAA